MRGGVAMSKSVVTIGREMAASLDFDSQAGNTAKLRMAVQEEANTKQRAREQRAKDDD